MDEIQNSYTNSTIFVEFVYEFLEGRNSYRRIGFRIDEIRIDEFRYEIDVCQFVLELQIRIRIQRNGTLGADGRQRRLKFAKSIGFISEFDEM